jgi:ComF family protein
MSSAPFWRALLDFFLPPKCPLCGSPLEPPSDERPCPSCLSQIRFFSSPFCPRCGIGFSSSADLDHLCSRCLAGEWTFARARSVGPYEGRIMEAISRFKFGGVARLAGPLGALLAEYADPEFPFSKIDLVIPVPLHPRRLRERGFNQSLLLARQVGKRRSIPLNFTALHRVRQTQPQTQLSGPERRKNVHGAFRVKTPEAVAGRKILLIDDVFTTGATIQECTESLLDAGAQEVHVLTLARVI